MTEYEQFKIMNELIESRITKLKNLGFKSFKHGAYGWRHAFYLDLNFTYTFAVYGPVPKIYPRWYCKGDYMTKSLEYVLEHCNNELRDVILFNLDLFI